LLFRLFTVEIRHARWCQTHSAGVGRTRWCRTLGTVSQTRTAVSALGRCQSCIKRVSYQGTNLESAGLGTQRAGLGTRLAGLGTQRAGLETRLAGLGTQRAGLGPRLAGLVRHARQASDARHGVGHARRVSDTLGGVRHTRWCQTLGTVSDTLGGCRTLGRCQTLGRCRTLGTVSQTHSAGVGRSAGVRSARCRTLGGVRHARQVSDALGNGCLARHGVRHGECQTHSVVSDTHGRCRTLGRCPLGTVSDARWCQTRQVPDARQRVPDTHGRCPLGTVPDTAGVRHTRHGVAAVLRYYLNLPRQTESSRGRPGYSLTTVTVMLLLPLRAACQAAS
jgi:hypothetical protein